MLLTWIFSIILWAVSLALKIISYVIRLLHLQVIAVYVIVGVLVQLIWGTILGNSTVTTVYSIGFVLVIIFTLLSTFRGFLSGVKLPPPNVKPIPKKTERERKEEPTSIEEYPNSAMQVEVKKEEKPVYYEVKQNKNYVMAEYSNRYELYLKTESGLTLIRTDLK